MSHVTTVQAQIGDLTCLGKAAEHLGMEFDRHAKLFMYYGGAQERSEAGVLRVKGNKEAYEMGLKQGENGKYDLLWDNFGGGKGLVNVVGQDAGLLKQEYAAQLAIKHASMQGMQVRRQTKQDGTIILTAE